MKKILSWATYDFANTIFSAIVLTAYFPLYFTEISTAKWPLGLATTSAMILAGLTIPFAGTLSDQTGKTKSYLIRTTLACISALLLFAIAPTPAILLLFYFFACFFYHSCLVFYNSLLPCAAPPEKQGFTSGLGTGLGYLGVVACIPIANFFDKTWGTPSVFLFAAAAFLLFSVPLIVWVPERKVAHPTPFSWRVIPKEWRKVWDLIKKLPQTPHLLWFLLGHFLVVDALNTMILWFLVYAREVFGVVQSELIALLLWVNVSAFVAGLIAGFVCDRLGAMKTLIGSAAILIITLISLPLPLGFTGFKLLCISGGAYSIAGIWTAGRKVLIELAPKEELGGYFGIFGLTIKVSVLGNLFFAIVADLVNFQAALWFLILPAGVGFLMLCASAKIRKTA